MAEKSRRSVLDDLPELAPLLNAPVLFGLAAQGHLPTVERMLQEGKSWDEIGAAIGWIGGAVEQHYKWAKEAETVHKSVE